MIETLDQKSDWKELEKEIAEEDSNPCQQIS